MMHGQDGENSRRIFSHLGRYLTLGIARRGVGRSLLEGYRFSAFAALGQRPAHG